MRWSSSTRWVSVGLRTSTTLSISRRRAVHHHVHGARRSRAWPARTRSAGARRGRGRAGCRARSSGRARSARSRPAGDVLQVERRDRRVAADQDAPVGQEHRGVVVGPRPVRLGDGRPVAGLRVPELGLLDRELRARAGPPRRGPTPEKAITSPVGSRTPDVYQRGRCMSPVGFGGDRVAALGVHRRDAGVARREVAARARRGRVHHAAAGEERRLRCSARARRAASGSITEKVEPRKPGTVALLPPPGMPSFARSDTGCAEVQVEQVPERARRPRPGSRGPSSARGRVVGRRDVPERLVVGLAERVERLAGGVVVDVAVREQVQAREQRQRARRRGRRCRSTCRWPGRRSRSCGRSRTSPAGGPGRPA